MPTITREIAGQTWTQDPTNPSRWIGPDDDPHARRTTANGYGGSDIIRTPEGFALRAGKVAPRTAWRTSTVPLTAKQHDTRSIMADPARRADWEAERRAENRARASVIAARRAELVALDTRDRFVDTIVSRFGVEGVAEFARHLPVTCHYTSKRGKVRARTTVATVILAEINGEYRRAMDDQAFGVLAADRHRFRARTMFAPVVKAAKATRERERYARTVATETPEQRDARRAKTAAKVRAHRAARKAALARPGRLTAEDANL